MAIRPVPQEAPNKFNPARLFLDDIEEIIRVFVEAEKNRKEKLFFNPDENLEITFQVDDQKCDELDDLKRIHPPSTYNFRVEVRRTGFNASFGPTRGQRNGIPTVSMRTINGELTTDWSLFLTGGSCVGKAYCTHTRKPRTGFTGRRPRYSFFCSLFHSSIEFDEPRLWPASDS
jgi:hypothetical protein